MKKLLLIICLYLLAPICMLGQEYDKYLNAAISLFEEGKYEKAQSSLVIYQKMTGQSNKELQKKITFCIEYLQKAEVAKINGQYDNAITCYKYVLSNNPKDPNISREINSLQNLLDKNQNSTVQEKTYKIGDMIQIGSYRGRIAYLDSSNKHGWIIINISSVVSYYPPSGMIYRVVPTKEELMVIYKSKDILGLCNEYWSSSLAKKEKNGWGNWSDDWYYTVDFSSGSVQKRRCGKKGKPCYSIEIMKF
ncbi:MAG: hypothetical protein K2I47_04045 [Odoribacter sp.]|nr:hypothetical protein [Odoribacter sp.]